MALDDLGEHGLVVAGLTRWQHRPDETRFTIRSQDVGGAPVPVCDLDPGLLQDLADDGGPVGAVHIQGLAGPLAADQHPTAAQPEVFGVVGLGRAAPRAQPRAGVLGLDPVAQPVPTPWGARQPADLRRQPVMMRRQRTAGLLVVAHRGGHRLDQVLGQVPDRPIRVLGPGQDPLDVHLGPQAHRMRRPGVGVLVELGQGVLPGLQRVVGVRVAVGAVDKHRGPVHIQRHVEGGPPQLEVRPRRHGSDDLPFDGTPHRHMHVRCQPALWLDRGEVLHLEPRPAAQVLHPPVDQLGEVHRIQRGPPVVIPGRVHRHPLTRDDPAVGGQRQGDEHRRPVRLPVSGGETPAHRPGLHRPHRQIRGVTPAPGRPHHPTRPVTVGVQVLGILVVGVQVICLVGPVVVAGLEVDLGQLVDAVPALRALVHPQDPGPLRARRTPRLLGRPTGQDHRGRLTGDPVHQPPGQRAHTHALVLRQPRDHSLVPVQRVQHGPAGTRILCNRNVVGIILNHRNHPCNVGTWFSRYGSGTGFNDRF